MRKKKTKKHGIIYVIVIVIALIAIVAISGGNSKDEPQSEMSLGVPEQNNSYNSTQDQSSESWEITHNNITVWKNSIGSVWMQGIVAVKNTGDTDLYCHSGKFDIENADGTLAATEDLVSVYPSVVAPGEIAYYYCATKFENGDPEASYTIVPNLDIEKAKVDIIRYATSEFQLQENSYGYIDVLGRIENTHTETDGMPEVCVILFDKNDLPIGILFTFGDEFSPGEKQGIDASGISLPDDVSLEDVARFEVYSYPVQYQF